MLEDIKINIAKLIALYEQQKQRSEDLEERLKSSEQSVKKYKEQIKKLNQEIDNLRLISAFNSAGPKTGAVERINKLILEIDKCIELLEY